MRSASSRHWAAIRRYCEEDLRELSIAICSLPRGAPPIEQHPDLYMRPCATNSSEPLAPGRRGAFWKRRERVRLRGRSVRGERLPAQAPFGHWNTQTFIAGLRCDRLTAPWIVDGAMDRTAFNL